VIVLSFNTGLANLRTTHSNELSKPWVECKSAYQGRESAICKNKKFVTHFVSGTS